MRILYVGDASSPHLRAWPAHFAARGHDVDVLHLRPDAPEEGIPGATVHLIPRPGRWSTPGRGSRQAVTALKRLIVELRPDIVHSHQILPAGRAALRAGPSPHVATAWGSEVLTASWRSRRRIASVARGADLLTADSRHLLGALRAAGAEQARLRWVPWGVQAEWPAEALALSAQQAAARARLPSDRPIVLSPRGPAAIYRQDVVLDAVSVLRAEHDVLTVIPLLDRSAGGADGARLRRAVAERGLEDAVRLVAPWSHGDFALALRAARVCVSVPERESAPNSVFEALAVGTPVVASRLPWTQEPVYREARLTIVPPGDAAALARGIAGALDGGLAGHADANRELVARHLDRGRLFGAVEADYERLRAAGSRG